MNDRKDKKPLAMNPAYTGDFNRVLKSLERRTKNLGETADIRDAATQVAIRAAVMTPSSARREITAVRAVCRWLLETGQWPEGVDQVPLTEDASMEGVEQLLSASMKSANELMKIGNDLVPDYTSALIANGFSGSEEEASQVVTGFHPQRSGGTRQNREDHRPITRRDLSLIDLALIDHPPEDGLKSLSRDRADLKALLRVFTRAIWLTGMRPVEVFECSLMSGDPNKVYSNAELRRISSAPEEAVMAGLLIPQSRLDPVESLGFARAVTESRDATGVEPVLMIRNAKTVNANQDLVRAYRAQILKNIPEDDLHIICLACMIREAGVSGSRRKSMITGLTRPLIRISREEMPHRPKPLNLYAFRHDFATRARRSMSIPRVASLMGHTSRTSTQGYGQKRTRKKGSGSGGWTPSCDEAAVERLTRYWGAESPGSSPETRHEPGS